MLPTPATSSSPSNSRSPPSGSPASSPTPEAHGSHPSLLSPHLKDAETGYSSALDNEYELAHEHDVPGPRESASSIERPPTPRERTKVFSPYSIHVLALLAPASILGTLARLGLQALATYDGRAAFPLVYVQGLGCFVMGVWLNVKDPVGGFYAPLYTAVTSGFCGSLTTFSGWQLDVFDSWIDATGAQRGGLYDAIDGIGKTVLTLCVSLISVLFGIHVSELLYPYVPRSWPSPPFRVRYTLSITAALMYPAAIVTYFRLSPAFRAHATAALLFAFPGALTRYILAVHVNPLVPAFPLGTFIANILGTAVLAGLRAIEGATPAPAPAPASGSGLRVSAASCALVQGLGDGLCGCLTTVSTFAVELLTLGRARSRWRYGLVSWVVGQAVVVLVYGSVLWTGNAGKGRTCVFPEE